MRLGLTNLAWDPSRDEAVAGLLARLSVDAIDVAPSKYFADVAAVREAEVRRVRDWWADRGIEITGMQSLLYGTQGLNLFGPPDVQQRMLAYLAAVCRVGAWLGATRLVFGSPANRNRAGLTDAEAWVRALEFFGSKTITVSSPYFSSSQSSRQGILSGMPFIASTTSAQVMFDVFLSGPPSALRLLS